MGLCVVAGEPLLRLFPAAHELRANFLQDWFMERREFLKKALEAARSFKAMGKGKDEVARLLARTASAAGDRLFN
jgi:endonuclease YncB( thermonuclease family)